mgnify:CR=1 FL=1
MEEHVNVMQEVPAPLQIIPDDKKIITSSTHLNPVSSLAGRPVFVGYPGWLWTRGISYADREEHLKDF